MARASGVRQTLDRCSRDRSGEGGRMSASKRRPANPGAQYGAALDRVRAAERDMRRAFHRWEKHRAALARCERRLDEAMTQEDPL